MSYFSTNSLTSLSSVPQGGNVYLIGICGTAMGQLAAELLSLGFKVSGSDKGFYEPMGSFLRDLPIKLFAGFSAENLTEARPDLVIIGNAITADNPEVACTQTQKLAYNILPKVAAELLIEGRTSIVVTGTHGKTTTSCLLAQVLKSLNKNPSIFVAGVIPGFERSLISGSEFAVIEGDEYDSAFFAKVPKFNFYEPDICIVNAVEFDHADIYPDLETINQQFTALVNSRPATATVLCRNDQPNLASLIKQWKTTTAASIVTFGFGSSADYRIEVISATAAGQTVKLHVAQTDSAYQFFVPLTGEYNAANAAAVFITLLRLEFSAQQITKALAKTVTPKRRQETIWQNEHCVIIEDFAHHPTAVTETITAFRQIYPDRKLVAIFEPASNTARSTVFYNEYLEALGLADQVFLTKPKTKALRTAASTAEISLEKLTADLNKSVSAEFLSNPAEELSTSVLPFCRSVADESVILLMSNSDFNGGLSDLKARLGGLDSL